MILDKPQGMTSTQAVAAVRRIFDAQKAGHAGTLDPLATGILAIALGEATKTVPFVQDADEDLSLHRDLGRSPRQRRCRRQGHRHQRRAPHRRSQSKPCCPASPAALTQVPPAYSAIKVDGERAYDLAREGEEVALEPRTVQVSEARLLGMPDPDQAEFEILCGKGTYVRSWVRDIALALGTLGHVSALRRTRLGRLGRKRRGGAGNPDPFYA